MSTLEMGDSWIKCLIFGLYAESSRRGMLCNVDLRETNACKYLKGGCQEDGTELFSDTQRQDKGQWAQTEAQEVPSEHEEELLFSREFVKSPSLEIFKTCLDKVLCSLL